MPGRWFLALSLTGALLLGAGASGAPAAAGAGLQPKLVLGVEWPPKGYEGQFIFDPFPVGMGLEASIWTDGYDCVEDAVLSVQSNDQPVDTLEAQPAAGACLPGYETPWATGRFSLAVTSALRSTLTSEPGHPLQDVQGGCLYDFSSMTGGFGANTLLGGLETLVRSSSAPGCATFRRGSLDIHFNYFGADGELSFRRLGWYFPPPGPPGRN